MLQTLEDESTKNVKLEEVNSSLEFVKEPEDQISFIQNHESKEFADPCIINSDYLIKRNYLSEEAKDGQQRRLKVVRK